MSINSQLRKGAWLQRSFTLSAISYRLFLAGVNANFEGDAERLLTLNKGLSTLAWELFVYHFNLLVDWLSGDVVARNMQRVIVTFDAEIKQALRSHAGTLVWEVAGPRLQAIGSTHRPPRIIRHRLPSRRGRALRLT